MLRCSWVWHIINIYSLSWRAIIISIDGFNVTPSISFHYYTVEWSAVVNNQMNEFGYLDPIIDSPPFVTCTIKLYREIWAQTEMVNSALMGVEGFFLPSPEQAHTTVTCMGRRWWVKTSWGNKSIHKSKLFKSSKLTSHATTLNWGMFSWLAFCSHGQPWHAYEHKQSCAYFCHSVETLFLLIEARLEANSK